MNITPPPSLAHPCFLYQYIYRYIPPLYISLLPRANPSPKYQHIPPPPYLFPPSSNKRLSFIYKYTPPHISPIAPAPPSYKPLSYVPVSKKGYWQIDMDDVTVSGESVTSVTSAILDSGTSLLVGPSADVKEIASKVVSLRKG